jgi:hypothetical protein
MWTRAGAGSSKVKPAFGLQPPSKPMFTDRSRAGIRPWDMSLRGGDRKAAVPPIELPLVNRDVLGGLQRTGDGDVCSRLRCCDACGGSTCSGVQASNCLSSCLYPNCLVWSAHCIRAGTDVRYSPAACRSSRHAGEHPGPAALSRLADLTLARLHKDCVPQQSRPIRTAAMSKSHFKTAGRTFRLDLGLRRTRYELSPAPKPAPERGFVFLLY